MSIGLEDIAVPLPEDWVGEEGATLPKGATTTLRMVGKQDGPMVAVLGGISATRIVADDGNEKGWWSGLVGQGNAVDLDHYKVVSMDFVAGDGCTPQPMTSADQARLFAHALSHVGIDKIDFFIGASFGGMVGLSFARQFKERASKLIIICAAHRPSPLAQGWRTIQRRILELGIEAGREAESVAIARGLAMTTYRSAQEFAERFPCELMADGGVDGYLKARGKAYVQETSAARYLTLSGSIDRHFERPEAITAPSLLIGFDSDQIVPLADIEDLAKRVAGPCRFLSLSSLYGHDAFLKEIEAISPPINAFLTEE